MRYAGLLRGGARVLLAMGEDPMTPGLASELTNIVVRFC